MDRRRAAACAMAVLAWAAGRPAWSQAAPRRIVLLTVFSHSDIESAFVGMFRAELHELGWDEGRNITLEVRSTEGRNDILPALAAELVAQAPDLLLVQSFPATRALMQATKTLPIVMVAVGNPIEHGLVADYRKPGGNVTGSAFPSVEATRKLLHLLKEAVPRLRSVALFINPSNEGAAPIIRLVRADAVTLDLQVQVIEVVGKGDFEAAFEAIRSAKTQAIMLPPEPLILSQREAIGAFAQAQGVPLAVVGGRFLREAGALLAFQASLLDYPPIAARQADLILKGAKPGEMPIEQPSHFELRINLRAARALGLTIPQSLLLQAAEVIE